MDKYGRLINKDYRLRESFFYELPQDFGIDIAVACVQSLYRSLLVDDRRYVIPTMTVHTFTHVVHVTCLTLLHYSY